MDRGGSDVEVTDTHVVAEKVMTVREKVDEILFQVELHSLLARLERVSPRSGKKIVERPSYAKQIRVTPRERHPQLLDDSLDSRGARGLEQILSSGVSLRCSSVVVGGRCVLWGLVGVADHALMWLHAL